MHITLHLEHSILVHVWSVRAQAYLYMYVHTVWAVCTFHLWYTHICIFTQVQCTGTMKVGDVCSMIAGQQGKILLFRYILMLGKRKEGRGFVHTLVFYFSCLCFPVRVVVQELKVVAHF